MISFPEGPQLFHRGRLDLAGALTSTVGMGTLVYAFIRAGSNGWNDAGTGGSIVLAVTVSP